MKAESIRILFVEDVSTDMELAIRELKKENVKFASVRVESQKEFVEQLEGFRPDIIFLTIQCLLLQALKHWNLL